MIFMFGDGKSNKKTIEAFNDKGFTDSDGDVITLPSNASDQQVADGIINSNLGNKEMDIFFCPILNDVSSFTSSDNGYYFFIGENNPVQVTVNGTVVFNYLSKCACIKLEKGDVITTNGNGTRKGALFLYNKETNISQSGELIKRLTDYTVPSNGWIIFINNLWTSIDINGKRTLNNKNSLCYYVKKGDIVYTNSDTSILVGFFPEK